MAYFAKLDENNIVIDITVADDINWVTEHLEGNWIETAIDGSMRYNYAGIGFTYDAIDDAFIEPYPQCGHDDVLLNTEKRWECADCEANAKTMQIWATTQTSD
jgi:hypothetical protein